MGQGKVLMGASFLAATSLLTPVTVSAQGSEGDAPTVGRPPPEREAQRPEVAAIADLGGVLTPKGVLVVEPGFQFSNSQVNRFTFLGTEILDTFLIGLVEAEDIDRDVIAPQINLRYGVTNRLEIGVKVPWLYREERRQATIPQAQTGEGESTTITDTLTGTGLGDVEVSLHLQMNRGFAPFFVGNLRYKSRTGRGPFEVNFDENGIEEDLATGSGFHGIEPSLTVIMPSDPAVFYGNVGYVFNLPDNVDKVVGSGEVARRIGEVNPGDSVRVSFGMGVSLNPQASFNIGYKHEFINGTETEIGSLDQDSIRVKASDLQVGSLLLGLSHAVGRRASANLNLEIGATADAPDVVLTLTVPISFGPLW